MMKLTAASAQSVVAKEHIATRRMTLKPLLGGVWVRGMARKLLNVEV